MSVLLAVFITAVLSGTLFAVVFASCYKQGLFIRTETVYRDPPVIPGEVIREEQEPFFDEKDVAAMEAHAERPEFHGTIVEINGVKVGADGLPEEMEPRPRTFWEKIRGDQL